MSDSLEDGRLRVLIVLDLDGTIARMHRSDEPRPRDSHRASSLPLDEAVVRALDGQARRPGVGLAWLTTWTRNQSEVEALVQHLFHGRLRGEHVPWVNWPNRGWRMRSLLAFIDARAPEAVVWADDQAPNYWPRRSGAYAKVPRLVLRPDKYVGLTTQDVDRIRSFLSEHLAASPRPATTRRIERDGGMRTYLVKSRDTDLWVAVESDDGALYVYVPNTGKFHRNAPITRDFYLEQELVYEPITMERARALIDASTIGALDLHTKAAQINRYQHDADALSPEQVLRPPSA